MMKSHNEDNKAGNIAKCFDSSILKQTIFYIPNSDILFEVKLSK